MGNYFKKPIDIKEQSIIDIDDLCLDGVCKHHVTINGVRTIMFGTDIIQFLQKNNIMIPDHFQLQY